MSLKFLGARDITAFGSAIAAAAGEALATEIVGMDKNGSVLGGCCYIANRDRYYTNGQQAAGRNGVFKLDPDMIDVSKSDYNIPLIQTEEFVCMGQPNPASLAQNAYTGRNNFDLIRLNVDTLGQTTPAFTGPNGAYVINTGGIGAGVPGGWTSSSRQQIFFEGLTDGIAGLTPLVGANVYPDGLAFSFIGDGTPLSDSVRRFDWPGWIDIRERRAVAVVPDFSSLVTSSITEPFYETPIDGDTFDWSFAQYIADTDATFATPKGLILQHNRTVLDPSPYIAGDKIRTYVRLSDFNPFDVSSASGVPVRTNGRVRLTSRLIAGVFPHFDLAGQQDAQNLATMHVLFDEQRGRFVQFLTHPDFPVADAGAVTVGFYAPIADPVIITPPIPVDVPRTNDIVDVESAVLGDLGEPIQGQVIDWTLTRRSTELEVLDASTFPGTSTVNNPSIDQSVPIKNEGTLSVIADGTPLVETTDYTVVLSTGVITWVTDQSGAALVTASYEHRLTAANPPNDDSHGTLLSATTISDVNGIVSTRILVPDDDELVGTTDNLNAEFPP